MPSQKRQRKKERHQSRQQALLAAQRRARLRQRAIVGVVVVALFAGIVAVVTATQGRDKKRNGDTQQGQQAAASCPHADGSSPRSTSFSAPFTRCIDTAKRYAADVNTNKGAFTITLDTAHAPNTVNNFVALARYHFYDGLSFHRVVPGFVVQGGDPKGDGTGGPGYSFADELPRAGQYRVGSVAMANTGPNTNGSQFFIVSGQRGAELEPKYSLFGQVSSGIETVKAIDALARPEQQGNAESGKPKEAVKIESVTIKET